MSSEIQHSHDQPTPQLWYLTFCLPLQSSLSVLSLKVRIEVSTKNELFYQPHRIQNGTLSLIMLQECGLPRTSPTGRPPSSFISRTLTQNCTTVKYGQGPTRTWISHPPSSHSSMDKSPPAAIHLQSMPLWCQILLSQTQ